MSDLQKQIRHVLEEKSAAYAEIQQRERARTAPRERLAQADEQLRWLQVQQTAQSQAEQVRVFFDAELERMKKQQADQQELIQQLYGLLNDLALFKAPELLNTLDQQFSDHLESVRHTLSYCGPLMDARALDELAKTGIGIDHAFFEIQMQIQGRAQYIRMLNELPVLLDSSLALLSWIAGGKSNWPTQVKQGLAYAISAMPPHKQPMQYLPDPGEDYSAFEHAKRIRHDWLMSGTGV